MDQNEPEWTRMNQKGPEGTRRDQNGFRWKIGEGYEG